MGKNLSRQYTHNKILISLKTIFSVTLHYLICIWHHSISKQLVFRVSNWFYISRAFFIPNCILYLKNILYNSVFRAAQVFLVYIKTNWFIIIRVAQGFRVVQYFLDFSETQCCSKPCSLNPCSSRTHCTITTQILGIVSHANIPWSSISGLFSEEQFRKFVQLNFAIGRQSLSAELKFGGS